MYTCFVLSVVSEQAMVEGELLFIGTSSIRNMGWSVHVMHDQYLWSVDFSAHWLDGGKLISWQCFLRSLFKSKV